MSERASGQAGGRPQKSGSESSEGTRSRPVVSEGRRASAAVPTGADGLAVALRGEEWGSRGSGGSGLQSGPLSQPFVCHLWGV